MQSLYSIPFHARKLPVLEREGKRDRVRTCYKCKVLLQLWISVVPAEEVYINFGFFCLNCWNHIGIPSVPTSVLYFSPASDISSEKRGMGAAKINITPHTLKNDVLGEKPATFFGLLPWVANTESDRHSCWKELISTFCRISKFKVALWSRLWGKVFRLLANIMLLLYIHYIFNFSSTYYSKMLLSCFIFKHIY